MKARGFSLIEVIITLSVLAVILTALTIPFIKRLDRVATQRETVAMVAIANAFKDSVRSTRSIPNENSWVAAVATQLGWQTNRVTANERGLSRIFLYDPTMQVGVNSGTPSLPYSQTISGSVVTNLSGTIIRPPNPRFMVISTTSSPLPSTLVSGVGDGSGPNGFNNIWNTPAGGIPTGWTFNTASDLQITRIDLTDLFIKISLGNADTRIPQYRVDGFPAVNLSSGAQVVTYYIRGSQLDLYNASGALEYSEVLYINHEFTFELGTWTTKPFLGRGVGIPTGKDMQRALDLFMRAPLNPYAQSGATQQALKNAMTAYMEAFVAWRDAGYPGEGCPGPVANNALSTAVGNARATLTTVSGNLINPR